jgi:hypothetical protein
LKNWLDVRRLDSFRLLEERFTYAGNGGRDRFRKALADEVVQPGSIGIGGCIRGFAFRRWLGSDERHWGTGDRGDGLREHRLRRRGPSVYLGGLLQRPDAPHYRLHLVLPFPKGLQPRRNHQLIDPNRDYSERQYEREHGLLLSLR